MEKKTGKYSYIKIVFYQNVNVGRSDESQFIRVMYGRIWLTDQVCFTPETVVKFCSCYSTNISLHGRLNLASSNSHEWYYMPRTVKRELKCDSLI